MSYKKFCLVCEEIKAFEYNQNIGHSECTICGGRFGYKLVDANMRLIKRILHYKSLSSKKPINSPYKLIMDYINKRIGQLEKNKEATKGRVAELNDIKQKITDGTLKKALKKIK